MTILEDEVLVFDAPNGERCVAVVMVIPEGAPTAVQEGIARRRLFVMTWECPCGAKLDYSEVQRGQVNTPRVEHEDDCPATDENLRGAIQRWMRRSK